MYDLIYEFITNDLIGTSQEVFGLNTILTHISIILFFIFLVKVLIWFGSFFSIRG